jgi:hypothetical protein
MIDLFPYYVWPASSCLHDGHAESYCETNASVEHPIARRLMVLASEAVAAGINEQRILLMCYRFGLVAWRRYKARGVRPLLLLRALRLTKAAIAEWKIPTTVSLSNGLCSEMTALLPGLELGQETSRFTRNIRCLVELAQDPCMHDAEMGYMHADWALRLVADAAGVSGLDDAMVECQRVAHAALWTPVLRKRDPRTVRLLKSLDATYG